MSAESAADLAAIGTILGDKTKFAYGSSLDFDVNRVDGQLRISHEGTLLGTISNVNVGRALLGLLIVVTLMVVFVWF
jgi:hypothetical protein